MDVCINPLSAGRQHSELAQVEAAISEIIACFQYIRPAVEWRRARLIYDDSIETRGLMRDSAGIIAEIGGLSNRDLRTQWFLYTKNHAIRAASDFCTVEISIGDKNELHLKGEIREELLSETSKWLSFGGTMVSEQRELHVSNQDHSRRMSILNAFSLDTFVFWWPRYEPSEKHRRSGYFREGGEWVSPMTLDSRTAQNVLIASVQDGNNRYGCYQGQYYRFPRTHVGQEIFHGFSITRAEVPDAVLADIENY